MSVMSIKSRVDIFALASTAREVFGEDQIMVAALVRETIHDRVLMKSNFSPARITHQEESHENDAYYTLCYLNQSYDARNNVLWRSGVPLEGLKFNRRGSKEGHVNGEKMFGVYMPRLRGGKQFQIWFLPDASWCSDMDIPSAFIHMSESDDSEENTLAQINSGRLHVPLIVQGVVGFKLSDSFQCFPDIKLGSYCAIKLESRPSKRRRTEQLSAEITSIPQEPLIT